MTTNMIFRTAVAMLLATASTLTLAQAQAFKDPVKVTPKNYQVLLDNDKVRVLEYTMKPGENEGVHSHCPGVLHVMGTQSGMMRSTGSDGKGHEVAVVPGQTFWREKTTHSAENIGSSDMKAIVVEIKTAACKYDD